MKLVEFSLRRRVTVSMFAVAVVLFGLVSFGRLPITLLPDLTYPSVTVETRLDGAAPAEMESLVTRPVEEVVGVVAGVKRLTSSSRPGLSQVVLEFDWGRNMDFAALDVRQKLDLLSLPREATKPVLLRFDPANDPVLRLYLTGGGDLYQLRYAAEEVLKKDLESTDGVAAIQVNGGYEEEIEVRLDQGKLSLLGLTIQDVASRLERANVNQAGGSLYEAEARYLVRSRNEFTGLADIASTNLTMVDGRAVTLADVAEVRRGHRQRDVVTRFGGQEAVELAIYKEGDANAVQVSRAVQERLERVRKELPEGVEAVLGVDQARFIQASIDDVLTNAWQGGLIAVLVLLLFLKDLRATAVIGLAIPISIIATFFLMYRTGTSLNVMSLGGLALGVGMLVDNAIVVLESIVRRREAGDTTFEAAKRGASEVGMAVVASTLTTIAVFAPVVFLEGVAAQLFRDQALTVCFSLVASLLVALTLIPMLQARLAGNGSVGTVDSAHAVVTESSRSPWRPVLASRPEWPSSGRLRHLVGGLRWLVWPVRALFALLGWLLGRIVFLARWVASRGVALGARAGTPVARRFEGLLDRLDRSYPTLLRRTLRSRGTVIAATALAFALAVAAIPFLGFDLVPQFSQGEFNFAIQLPDGTPLETTDRFVASASEALIGDTRVASFSSISGGAGLSLAGTGTEGENSARLQVRMAPGSSREDEEAVVSALRARLEREATGVAGVRFEFERPTFFSFRTPIEVEIYGDSLAELHDAAAVVSDRLAGVPGLVDVQSSAQTGNPEVQVTFDRERLLRLGLDLSQVADTVRSKVQGAVATRFLQGDREIDIRVRTVEVGVANLDDVRQLIVTQRDGVPIPLGAVAEVRVVSGPGEIRRLGQKRAAVVAANLRDRDMGSAAAEVRRVLAATPLPAGVAAQLSGQEEEMARSMRSMMLAAALAAFLVYLVMASQFESLLHPFVILLCLPLGLIGAVLGLAIGGYSINVVAMIGIVMLAGIVVNNGIVLIDAVNQLRAAGRSREEALIEAGRTRMRPILMTTATTVLGLLPMAIGWGEGAELRAPLAVTVIGGLTVGTVLTLFVLPALYTVLDRKRFAADLEAQAQAAADDRAVRSHGTPGDAEPAPAAGG